MRTKCVQMLDLMLSGKPATFEFDGSIDNAIQRLTAVAKRPKRRTFFPIFQRSQGCIGTVSASRVRLASAYRNWYDLTFTGKLSHQDGVTRLEGNYAVHPFARVELVVTFAIGFCALLWIIIDMFTESSMAGMKVAAILLLIAWIGGVLLFIRLGASSAEAEVKVIDAMIRKAMQH